MRGDVAADRAGAEYADLNGAETCAASARPLDRAAGGSRSPSWRETASAPASVACTSTSREPRRPIVLSGLVGDQILAYLQLDMRQPAPLAVDRHSVVRVIAHRIGRVVADHEIGLGAQQIEHDRREPPIAIVEHPDMHGTPLAPEDRRETVHRDQHGAPPRLQARSSSSRIRAW